MGINLINMKISTIVLAAVALFALMLVFATRNDVSQTVGATVSAREDVQLDDNWREAGLIMLKEASLADTAPKVVKTEVVVPDLPSLPFVVLDEEKLDYVPKQRHVELDVCQRHKMHKVQRGRSWHCKR
jgi:hypothetical protein